MNTKTCYNEECPEENPQPLTNFHKQSTGKLGVRSRCRTCHNQAMRDYERKRGPEWRRKKTLHRYGITPQDYNRMFKEQEGKCAICQSTDSEHPTSELLVVDHCHLTGKVRGLLCNTCNRGIGWMREETDRLLNAAVYLENAKA